MPYSEWQPGLTLQPPIYLDSSVLVTSFVTNDRRYEETTQLFADLLTNQAQMFISILTVSESLWGLAKVSYLELYHQKPSAHFAPHVFRKHLEAIYERYGDRLKSSMHDWLRDWRAAGIKIDLLPTSDDIERISAVAPVYMQTFQLASADAVHLATAEAAAASFFSTDTEFQRVDGLALQIFRITGSSTVKG